MASLIVFSLKTTAIEFDVVWQFKFPILAVRQVETKDEVDVDGAYPLDVVHDFGDVEFPGWLQRKVDVVGIDFEAKQIELLDFHGVGHHINQDIAKNVLLKIGVLVLATGGQVVSRPFDINTL
jgi:hypothetical protein